MIFLRSSQYWRSTPSRWRNRSRPASVFSGTYFTGTHSRLGFSTGPVRSWRSPVIIYGTVLIAGAISYALYLRQRWPSSSADQQGDVPVIDIASLKDPKLCLPIPTLSSERVDKRLRANEASFPMSGLNIGRYDRTTLPSNSVMEDAHSEAIIEMVNGHRLGFWGIYDGHIGPAMSTALSKSLINAVALELGRPYSSMITPSFDSIEQAIQRGFSAVDNYLVWERHRELLRHIPPSSSITEDPLSLPAAQLIKEALTGSCALLSIYDSQSRVFYVALAGDSRAVLGRRNEQNTWTATALSLDQYASNPSEEARIQSEHPGEPDVLKNKRLLGSLQPTRSFGDLYYKWSDDMQTQIRAQYLNDGNLGRQLAPNVSPPYLTAQPVVTSVEIQPQKGDFVVMASDGLWELLSNEEVVALVGRWIDQQKDIGPSEGRQGWKKWISSTKSTVLGRDSTGQKRPEHGGLHSIHPDNRFVLEDQNAATHLLRNALGGQLHDGQVLRAMLTLSQPLSRKYRDDLTIMVIFFGDIPSPHM